MNKVTSRLIITLIISYLVLAILGLVISAFGYPGDAVISDFQLGWIIASAFEFFMANLVTMHIFAVALCYSVFADDPTEAGDPSGRFLEIIRGPVVVVMIVLVVVVLLQGIVLPIAANARMSYEARSERAMEWLDEARENRAEEDWQSAATAFANYLALVPEDPEVTEEYDAASAQAEIARQDSQREDLQPAPSAGLNPIREESVVELVHRAERLLEAEDYFSAHYFATLALQMDPNREDAAALAARAWNRIRNVELSDNEREQLSVFEAKQRGYQAYQTGEYVEAYYIFEDLRQRYPRDPDVQEFYPLILAEARDVSFFIDEARDAQAAPGVHRILFRNRFEPDLREFVSFDRLVETRQGTFAYGIEVIAYRDGRILYQAAAPYGKFLGSNLVTLAIDREDAAVFFDADYVRGEPLDGTPNSFELTPDLDEIFDLSSANSLSGMSVPDLLRVADVLDRFGYQGEPARMELLMHLFEVFSLVILSFLAMAVGWRMRSRYLARPPIAALLLLPLLPLMVSYLYQLYEYAARIVIGTLVLASGMSVAIGVFVTIQAVMLVVSMMLLALQATE